MSSIRRLERVLNEVSSNVDYRRFRRGVPSGVLKQIFNSEWKFYEKRGDTYIFMNSYLSDVSGTDAEDLRGYLVYTLVKIDEIGEINAITVKLTRMDVDSDGPAYTYSKYDANKPGGVSYLFQRAEEMIRDILDINYDKWGGYPDSFPKPRTIRRGRYWGSESRRRVGTSESRLRANRSRRQVGTSESRLRASRLRRGRLSRRVR